MNFEKLERIHDKLEDHYDERNELYKKVDEHVHSIWELPENVANISWMRTVRTTDPADAVATTVRTFATHEPKFRITPLANNEANRLKANEIEQVLRWQWKKASRRSEIRPLWNIVESAARYGMVALQVSYLPCQFETYKTLGKDTRKAKAALDKGPFVMISHHPSGIYPLFSDMMLEGVLSVRNELADDFANFWGDRAKEIKKRIKDESTLKYVTYWDYMDYDERVIYAFLKTDQSIDDKGEKFEIVNESHKLPFLPWVVKKWGNTLDAESQYRVSPMLGSVIESEQWYTQNILESINTSLVIQRAASPVAYDETPSGEGLDTDFSEAVSTVHGVSGMTKYQPLPPATVDAAVTETTDRFGARMSKATVARVLQNLDIPAGTASSSISQVLDAAMSSIAPYKLLAQDVVADAAKLILEWPHYYKDDLRGMGSGSQGFLKGTGTSRSLVGEEFVLRWDEINLQDIDIEVQLTPYIPIDQVALINAGILANKNLKMPLARIMEEVGVEDPEAAMEEWEQERQDESLVQLDIQKQQLELQTAIQQQAQQQQMQAQMQMQQQQQAQMAQQANAQAMANNPPAQNIQPGGQGFNPSQGGQPPVDVEVGVGRRRGRPESNTGLK